MDEPYFMLINAIILQAIKDYNLSLKRLQNNPENFFYKILKEDVESFCRGGWFTFLTDLDGEWILKKIQEKNDKQGGRKK